MNNETLTLDELECAAGGRIHEGCSQGGSPDNTGNSGGGGGVSQETLNRAYLRALAMVRRYL